MTAERNVCQDLTLEALYWVVPPETIPAVLLQTETQLPRMRALTAQVPIGVLIAMNLSTPPALGHVLHSKKSSTDSRVLAAKTIGDIGLADGVKQLSSEATCDDWRVLARPHPARVAKIDDVAAKDPEGVAAEDRQAGVEDVGRRHAQV